MSSPAARHPDSGRPRQGRPHRRALLTAHDERLLARAIDDGRAARERIANGSPLPGDDELVAVAEDARHRFIESNIRLVQSIANKFGVPAHLDRDDLVQDGMIGLDKAVEKFDGRRGYKFSTYATWWIRQAIQRGLENSATTIRIPGHRSRELRTALVATPPGQPLAADVAMVDMLSHLESMDRVIGDGHVTLGALVRSDDESPEDQAERRALGGTIDALLEHLDPTSRFAVAARYGLRGHEPATFGVIAAELGVTPQAARRRVERALDKLRTHAEHMAA